MHSRVALNLKYPDRAAVLSVFAFSAILLAAVGLFGVLAQFVARRTQEIGIRMAVGADRRNIATLVAWKGGLPFLAGLGIGLAASLALTRYLSTLLYGITPTDPVAFGAVFAAMLAAAALAMVFPAKRVLSVDPMAALRVNETPEFVRIPMGSGVGDAPRAGWVRRSMRRRSVSSITSGDRWP
jgi:predicted lysophospholipase L1 biosynthesis ABC-type transport system permease subunit